MDFVWGIIFVLSISQLSSGSENRNGNGNGNAVRSSHLIKRNIIPRSPSRSSQTLNETPDGDEGLPGRVVYQVNDDLPSLYGGSSLPYENLPSEPLGDSYLRSDDEDSNLRSSYADEGMSFIYGDRLQQPPLSQKWQTFGNDLYSYDNSNSNSVKINNNNNKSSESDDVINPVEEEERLMLQKRMQMKGMGLLGSSKGGVGQPSLTGISKSRPKGLVLSIDLGIKALRDAIMHAKFQQKNKQHQMQAQKNMRLLHNIGKRRAQYLTEGRL